jgi:predicted transcriptional regulator
MATKQTKEFNVLAKNLMDSGAKREMTVRELLALFGQAKRGREVARFIKYKLRYFDLETVPAFDRTHIDSKIVIQAREEKKESGNRESGAKTSGSSKTPIPVEIAKEIEAEEDSTPHITVGLVMPPDRPMHTVRPSDPLSKVVTLLMMEHVSHVAVLQSVRKAEGLVTWKSVGTALHSGRNIKTALDCMEQNPRVITLHTPLLKAIEEVLQYGAVLVEGEDKSIKGIFTADDVAKQFIASAQPFLILEDIENRLRKLIRKLKLNAIELRDFVDPADEKRRLEARQVEDLTFGEYARIVQSETLWPRFRIQLERSSFYQRLNQIREIRNSVMHFHPDGITSEERSTLTGFRDLLQQL